MQLSSSVALCLCIVLRVAYGQQWVPEESGSIYSTGYDPAVIATEMVSYNDGNVSLQGFVAYDNSSSALRPGVLVVPDWDGVGNYEYWRAKLLASLGYVAFVADVYGADVEQGPSLPIPDRIRLTRSFTGDIPMFRQRLIASLMELSEQSYVDAGNLAAIGYCFGGSGVLELMRAWPEDGVLGLKGVVPFHAGRLSTSGSLTAGGNPIYVSVQHGAEDESVDPADIEFLQDELTNANVTWEFTSYGATVHAFTEPSLVPGRGNSRYSEWADFRSWAAMKSFFTLIFSGSQSANPYA